MGPVRFLRLSSSVKNRFRRQDPSSTQRTSSKTRLSTLSPDQSQKSDTLTRRLDANNQRRQPTSAKRKLNSFSETTSYRLSKTKSGFNLIRSNPSVTAINRCLQHYPGKTW